MRHKGVRCYNGRTPVVFGRLPLTSWAVQCIIPIKLFGRNKYQYSKKNTAGYVQTSVGTIWIYGPADNSTVQTADSHTQYQASVLGNI